MRFWNAETKKQEKWISLETNIDGGKWEMERQGKNAKQNANWPADAINSQAKGRSVAVCKQGKYIAVGTFGGLLRVWALCEETLDWKEISNCLIKHT
jgi:hypothetical protein